MLTVIVGVVCFIAGAVLAARRVTGAVKSGISALIAGGGGPGEPPVKK